MVSKPGRRKASIRLHMGIGLKELPDPCLVIQARICGKLSMLSNQVPSPSRIHHRPNSVIAHYLSVTSAEGSPGRP
ncbi:hypothetical protein An15g02920 [Aspergillus niger]|uniref:Uncharacterized protein n=2 Tax=Aspergillus niger TaxID=5061 RepID=A2R572_ASPNC|nr:hypothetical protein An15g02920 [Aspergillus niger]CAK42367.1 hypothetical protein An15g02920 [Aspergillus niger]